MLKLVIKKIKNKKWLSFCLILGISFLVAVFSCRPMFKSGAMDMTLKSYFNTYIEENNRYPTSIGRGKSFGVDESFLVDDILAEIEAYEDLWNEYLSELDTLSKQTTIKTNQVGAKRDFSKNRIFVSIDYQDKITDHIDVVAGKNTDEMLDGAYPCLISEKMMDDKSIVLGEKLYFAELLDDSENPLCIYVAGIIRESDAEDYFWYNSLCDYDKDLFLSKEHFDEIMKNYSVNKLSYIHNNVIDHHSINSQNIEKVQYYIEEFQKEDKLFRYSFEEIVDKYVSMDKKVGIILYVMELPILMLTLAFIYMVSKQIIDSETEEIAMLKSRGMSRFQVIRMYILQAIIVGLIGYVVGIPLGCLFCFVAGNTTDFLTYGRDYLINYSFNPYMLVYGLIAVALAVIFIVLPTIGFSKMTVTSRKKQYERNKKSFWEKYYLDVLLLALSVYLLRNYNKQIDDIRINTLIQGKLDPVIFIDVILFIFAAGLLALRLIHYIVKLVYFLGRKKWKTNTYTAFLQITRTFEKQSYISIFMILTIAMGIFDANTARTISKNNQERIAYEQGADVRFKESWVKKVSVRSKKYDYDYVEPDYGKYSELLEDSCESYTKVIMQDNIISSVGSISVDNCIIQGINTKEFGETAELQDEFNTKTHWFEYLNELSQRPEGIIISKNLADTLLVSEGDMVSLALKNEEPGDESQPRGVINGKICAIVEDWPAYGKFYYEDGEEKERYFIVANYTTLIENYRQLPYEIWAKLKPGHDASEVESILNDKNITISKFDSTKQEIEIMKNSSFIQTTNGMFTLGFVVTLCLCMIGFLIYWIISIRKRELHFGIYRAMGMSIKEVNMMLLYEHIFSTLLSIVSGIAVGIVSMVLFTRLYCLVYLPEKHNVDIVLAWEISDMVKLLAIVGIVLIICAVIIRRQVKKLNITKALKLGEE